MSNILFVQYPKCGTCQKAAKWLRENNVNVDSRDIAKDNPTKEELTAWIKQSGLPITKFFNTSGNVYKENNLKDKVKTASNNELIEILSSNGMVVKRPIVVTGKIVLVGFNEAEWSEKLKKEPV